MKCYNSSYQTWDTASSLYPIQEALGSPGCECRALACSPPWLTLPDHLRYYEERDNDGHRKRQEDKELSETRRKNRGETEKKPKTTAYI